MIFKPRQKRYNIDLLIMLNDHKIDLLKEVVFLGVILDAHISWKPHISHVARKMSKSIGIINKSSFYLSKSSLYTLYYSLVYPYLQYCIIVQGHISTQLILIVLSCFRSVQLELLARKHLMHTLTQFFKSLKFLNLKKFIYCTLGKFMYSYKNMQLSSSKL